MGPCDQSHVLRACPCTVDLCAHLSDKKQIQKKKNPTLTSINAHMHGWLACTRAHTHNGTGKYSADQRFMCWDLSLAIKIHLIFTRVALHCSFLNRSPTRHLQPLSLTFSPARKTPAALLFLHQLPSFFPSISSPVSLHLFWPLLWFYLYRVCLRFSFSSSSSCPCPLLSYLTPLLCKYPLCPRAIFFLIVSFPPEWSICHIYLTVWE